MTEDRSIIPCDVQAVLQAKCLRCHGDPLQNGAPFPLITLEQVHMPASSSANAARIYERMALAVESGFMPLMDPSIMPPVEPLTEAEKTTLLGWLEDGAQGVMGPEVCP